MVVKGAEEVEMIELTWLLIFKTDSQDQRTGEVIYTLSSVLLGHLCQHKFMAAADLLPS